MPKVITETLYPYLYLFIADVIQLPNMSFEEYEMKEPRYAEPFLDAYVDAFSQPTQGLLSHDLFKRINRIALQHLPLTRAGQYRDDAGTFFVSSKDYNEKIRVASYTMTDDGLVEFIEHWFYDSRYAGSHAITFEPRDESEPLSKFYFGHLAGATELVWGVAPPGKSLIVSSYDSAKHLSRIKRLMHDYKFTCTFNIMPWVGDPEVKTHQYMDFLIKQFNTKIKTARTNEQKLILIAEHIQRIEQLHPFLDGNVRTCYIILNKLLHDYQLPLTVLFNPNVFDCCDLNDIVAQIKDGQRLYLHLLANDNPELLMVDATNTPWMKFIACRPYHGLDAAKLAAFCQRVLHVPTPASVLVSEGLFSVSRHPKQDIVNDLIVDLLPLLAANDSRKCPEIREALEQHKYALALRKACGYEEFKIALTILEYASTLGFDVTECSLSTGKSALDWLVENQTDSMDKCVLIDKLQRIIEGVTLSVHIGSKVA